MSQKKARVFSRELKLAVVKRVLAGESVAAVAGELAVRRKLIYEWKDRYVEMGEGGLRQAGRPRRDGELGADREAPRAGRGELLAARRRIAELERKVGQQEIELDFFGEALRRIEARKPAGSGKRSTR